MFKVYCFRGMWLAVFWICSSLLVGQDIAAPKLNPNEVTVDKHLLDIFPANSVNPSASPTPPESHKPVVAAPARFGGEFLKIGICTISALIIGLVVGLMMRQRKENGPVLKNKGIATVALLILTAILLSGLVSLYFDLSPQPEVSSSSDTVSLSDERKLLPEANPNTYHLKPSYPAPGPEDPPLMNTHDLVDAFLRAPNWQARIPYIMEGEALEDKIRNYYKTWPDFRFDRFKMKLFQLELEEKYGGPFWVYQIIETDTGPAGTPLIVRVEDGDLKVDWELYSEFKDQHFVKYREAKIKRPRKFRLVAERVATYSGPDATHMKGFDCYQLNPPYGGFRAFSEYAFVKKGSDLASKLDRTIGSGKNEPLAVIFTIDAKEFSPGVTHYIITDFISEGWFEK